MLGVDDQYIQYLQRLLENDRMDDALHITACNNRGQVAG